MPSVAADVDPVAWVVHAAAERLAGREPPGIPVPRTSIEAPPVAEASEETGSVDIPSLYRELRMLAGNADDAD